MLPVINHFNLFSLIMKIIEVVRGRVLRWQKGLVR